MHRRWVPLLRTLDDDAWARTLFHPEEDRTFRLDHFLGLYAWHGKHHVAHVTALRGREGW